MPPSLPAWVAYIQALGPTIATVAVATFTIWIASRQACIAREQADIAREKIAHDFYDRRYAIYLVFETMIRVLMGQKDLGKDREAVLAANIAAHQAPFILDREMSHYLLDLHALGWRIVNAQDSEVVANHKELPPQERLARVKQYEEDTKTLLNEAPVLANKFMPFLRLRDFRRN
jgi:hypothetical protein